MENNIDIGEQIKKLIELNKVDQEIYDLKSLQETFPEKIKELENLLNSQKKGLEEAEEKLKGTQLRKNDKENDLKEKEEKIKKHEGELNAIKNNKEYTALQQEIESLKADASLLEEEIIALLDEVEEADKARERARADFEGKTKEAEKEKKRIKEEEENILGKIKGLESKKNGMAGTIDASMLKEYNRILENRGRTALAAVNGESCGECKMTLRPQVINDVKLLKKIVYCESCGRMLYAED